MQKQYDNKITIGASSEAVFKALTTPSDIRSWYGSVAQLALRPQGHFTHADVEGDVYGCKPEQVWATWEEIKPGFFVEGANSVDQQPATTHPPVGELICFEGKSADVLEKVLIAAGTVLSRELGIPGNIFITYREAKSGQVIAGNGIIRRGLR